ncbi:clostridium P-47 family protein [Clostridium botulinum 202F]|nr:OrfX2 [Clostridium botulinum]AIY80058.1 clostridium P-47 family protein [Clostridium botulinum 202F]KAI3345738.1 TULIP family P47-like protein [Clostridium botulinum]KON12234.1 toxin [Clostridium botulinum]MBY6985312.1 TULIP family P47-like protein [Clostridium botulinum]
MTNLKPYIIYDWKKTILKNTKENYSVNEIMPKTFFMDLHGKNIISATLNGTWKSWNLTDEGVGEHPIFKYVINDGYLQLNSKDDFKKISLKNVWIKLSMKINANLDGTYSISKNKSSFYIKDNSLQASKDNLILDKYLNKLMFLYFKDNIPKIEAIINKSRIQTKIVSDLSLLGWDIENSVSYKTMNEFIKKDNLYPKDFEAKYTYKNKLTFIASGKFSPWEMTTGADGQNIRFKCPIESATYDCDGTIYNASTENSILIQVDLSYFNSDTTIQDPTGLNNGKQFNLKIKTNENSNKNVTIINCELTSTDGLIDEEEKDFLSLAFKNWFNENIGKFDQIFSYILLGETAKNPAYQWLKPTQISYGSASVETETNIPNLDSSTFAAMCMVENHINSIPSHAVDNRMLELSKTQAAFGISFPLFLEKFLKQGLLSSQFISEDDIEVDTHTLIVTNKNQIKFGKVTNGDKQIVDSFLEPGKLRLSLQNNLIVLELFDLNWQQLKGVTGHFDFRQEYELKLINQSGKFIPSLEKCDEPEITYSVEEDKWVAFNDMLIGAALGTVFSMILGAGVKLTGMAISKGTKLLRSKAQTVKNKKKIYLDKRSIRQLKKDSGVDQIELKRISRENSVIASEEITLLSNNGSTNSSNLAIIKNKSMSAGKRIAIGSKKIISTISMLGAMTLGMQLGDILSKYIRAKENDDYSAIPGINKFMDQCIGAMRWPDENSELKVNFAKLQGIYLLGGTLEKNNEFNIKQNN